SSRRRHTRFSRDWVQTCALPIWTSMKKLLHWCSAALIAAVLLLPSSSLAQSQGPTFRSPTDQELAQTKNPGANWITYGGALNNRSEERRVGEGGGSRWGRCCERE